MKVYDIFEKGNIQYIPRERREIIYKICDGDNDIMTLCKRSILYLNFTGAGAAGAGTFIGATTAGAGKVKELELQRSWKAKELGLKKKKPMAATPPQAHRKKEKERGKREQKETKQKRELLLRT